jgi:hypothetical protein
MDAVDIETYVRECPFCFEQRECDSFPVFVNGEGETVWMDGCDDCIAQVNPVYALQLGLDINAGEIA